jgi:hypothetical protein
MYEPRYRQAIPRVTIRRTMVQKKLTSEPLRLEHGDAYVDEHHDGNSEEESLNPGHTRSRHQMRPMNTATNATKPRIAKRSAMGPSCRWVREPDVNAADGRVNRMSIPDSALCA